MGKNDMSCCGQNRQAWRQWNAPKPQAAPAPPFVLQHPVHLQRVGASSIVVMGEATGQTYLFAGRDAGLGVDERDAPALLATGRFINSPAAESTSEKAPDD
jgi:hypothetical protein